MPLNESVMIANFLIACIYSLPFAVFVFVASRLLSRKFRSLQAWPTFWLAGIFSIALPILLSLLLIDFRPLTKLELYAAGSPTDITAAATHPENTKADVAAGLNTKINDLLVIAAPYWLAIYVCGLLLTICLQIFRYIKINKIVSAAATIDPLNDRRLRKLLALINDDGAKRYLQCNRLPLRITTAVHSPFVVCCPRTNLIISKTAMEKLSDAQLALVLEHELIHLANKDPLRLIIAKGISALLWFNPFVQKLNNSFNLAIELKCDARTLAQKPNGQHQYLKAMLSIINAGHQYKHQLNGVAFGNSTALYLKARIIGIQHPVSLINSRVKKLSLCGGLILLVSVNTAFQPTAFAQPMHKEDLLRQLRVEKPVETGRISSTFGLRIDPF